MGSGKTTVAQALARALDCRLVDLDRLITERLERTPKEIIEEDGEPAFREVETRFLQEVLADGSARVIALGGGAWTVEATRDLVTRHNGFTVWLDAPFEVCWQRIEAAGSERPLARDKESALQLYQLRRAAYELTELCIAAAAERSVGEMAAEIKDAIETSS
jgi:shikimate kinase